MTKTSKSHPTSRADTNTIYTSKNQQQTIKLYQKVTQLAQQLYQTNTLDNRQISKTNNMKNVLNNFNQIQVRQLQKKRQQLVKKITYRNKQIDLLANNLKRKPQQNLTFNKAEENINEFLSFRKTIKNIYHDFNTIRQYKYLLDDYFVIMLADSKFKKPVGFIRKQSSKQLIVNNNKQDSLNISDDFSSFSEGGSSDNQFSPYRQPNITSKYSLSNIPTNQMVKNRKNPHLSAKQQYKRQYHHMSDKKIRDSNKIEFKNSKLTINPLGKMNNQIKQQMMKIKEKCEEIGKLKVSKKAKQFLLLNQQQQSNESRQEQSISQKKQHEYEDYLIENNSFGKINNQQNLKVTNKETEKQNENHEELIAEYSTRQFIKKGFKQMQKVQDKQTVEKIEGIQKNKGGICYQLDVKQFNIGNHERNHNIAVKNIQTKNMETKKRKKIDTKQEIIQRRNTAKKYDQQTRLKMFGGF